MLRLAADENLNENIDPFPEVTAARRIDFSFERRDGLEVQGRVSLPVGWVEGQKVPAIFWTYPREYTEPELYEAAAIEARNKNAFTHMSWLRWSDLWLTQGYALVYPDIPIIGENYNDTYIGNLVDAMYAAIRAVDGLGVVDIDRIGHGGHSYGAFATANLLAKAAHGIAELPGSLYEAIEEVEKSALIKETLGDHIFTKFIENKKIEWDAYRMHVSAFEIDKYLPIL